ncbi:ABC transporter permease [Neptuniibacter marinus]|uniref:ABC transporter permease n=1 Tax=Neptuniibacter marinus TaxID=1806670 RepID=UPI00082D5D3F|nr:FtsX-like permease family protein [Neptuniibacter marinus]
MSATTPIKLAAQQSISCLKLSEWRSLIIALVLAITIASLMAVLGERIERTLLRQGSDILGADLILSSSRGLTDNSALVAEEMGITSSEVVQLGTMASSGGNFLLVTIRALQSTYPRGTIVLDPPLDSEIPNLGEAWAEQSALDRLNLKLGDQVTLGSTAFTISAVIKSAPDRGRGFISFNPQLIINRQQLEQTGLLGPGARLRYSQLFAGTPEQISALEQSLKQHLKTGEKLTSIASEEGQQNSALSKASSYLRLGALFALLISAMTIFLSLRRFTQSQYKRAALLKTLGVSDHQILLLYITQFIFAWALCSIAGVSLALLLENLGLTLLQGVLPQPVPAASSFTYLSGPLLGISILLCLGLPSLFKLQKSNPLQLIQDQTASLSWGSKLPYLIAIGLLIISTTWYLNNILLTISLILCLLLIGGLLGSFGAYVSKQITKKLAPHHPMGNLLLSRVQQQQRWYRVQIPVICLLFSLLSINLIALNDLLSRWQDQLPEDTPNHFLINIQEWEKDDLQVLLQQNKIDNPLWPIYRGRLNSINDLPLSEALTKKQQDHPSLNRELNLTSTATMPAHNTLIKGQWDTQTKAAETQDTQPASVSIEEKIASELGLKLGDIVGFNIGGIERKAEVQSIRRVQWDSFQPNFYFIFSPGLLEDLSASYLTSFHLDKDNASVSRQLMETFPTLTLIDVRQILEQLQHLLTRLSMLSSLLMLLTTSAGLILLYVTLTQELEQRRYENALLQTLGASQQQCRQLDRMEMGLIGLISGFLAVVITEVSLWPIHQQLLKLDPVLHPYLWISLPLLSCALFMLISKLSHRQQSLAKSYNTLISR